MKRGLRGWRLLLFARCKHTSLVDSDELDGPVSWDRWWAARLHRLACRPCRKDHRRHRWLIRMLAAVPDVLRRREAEAASLTLSEDAKRRIRESLAAAQRKDQQD